MCQDFVKSLPAMSLREMGRWVSSTNLVLPEGENSMAVSGLGCENPSVGVVSHFECKWN